MIEIDMDSWLEKSALVLAIVCVTTASLLMSGALSAGPTPTPTPLPRSAPAQQRGFFPPLPSVPDGGGSNPNVTVSLPIDAFDTSVPASTVIIEPVTTTLIDSTTTGGANYVGFQGDFTFDSAVVTFSSPYVQRAGLTSDPNWNVSANILNTGPGTTETLRVSAFSTTLVPLNGSGTLYELRMLRVSNTSGAVSPLVWAPVSSGNEFIFIDDNLNQIVANQTNGLITIIGGTPPPT